jgi:hypothetical protein
MELQIIDAEEWMQEVCELLVENAYFGPIVDGLQQKAEVTEEAVNQASQHLKGKRHWEEMVQVRLFQLDRGLLLRRDTGALCIPLDRGSDIMSEAHDCPLGGAHQGAE